MEKFGLEPSFSTSRFWEPQASAGGEGSWSSLSLPVAWIVTPTEAGSPPRPLTLAGLPLHG